MTDDDFLRAIRAAPNDDAVRFVYADWLEEQGDPRAEFLRTQVALAAAGRADGRWGALQANLSAAAAGLDPAWVAAVCRVPLLACLAMVGAWHMEGIVTLLDRPDPDRDDAAWKANPTAPTTRAIFRGIGYVFRADGTGQFESRNARRLPPAPFSWWVKEEAGCLFLFPGVSSAPNPTRIWVRPDGRMLWAIPPPGHAPATAQLLIRDDPPPTFRGARRRR